MKNMRKCFLVFSLIGLLASCVPNDAELPPVTGEDPNIKITATIAQVKAMYTPGGPSIQLSDTLVVSGLVVADDQSGNFYKSIVIQDASAGILIRMGASNLYQTYPVGRRVCVKLGGLWIGEYNGLIQLGGAQTVGTINQVDYINSALFDKVILKGTFNNPVVPVDVDIASLNSSHQNMLIRLTNVQFISTDTGMAYAPGVATNRTLEDCSGAPILVRTSSFANFAYNLTPGGNGEFVCIYSEFSTTPQLIIRQESDLKMNAVRCGPYAKKDFEDGSVTSGGWTVQHVTDAGTNWVTNTIGVDVSGGTTYGQCSNYYSSANHLAETWLISPSFDLTAGINPVLTFINGCNYSGAALQVKVSSDYVSGNPNLATWTSLVPVLSGGSWAWVSSGALNLSAFNGQSNVHVGFEYTGTASDGKTWELDNILVTEQ
jgi:hypothetical protein